MSWFSNATDALGLTNHSGTKKAKQAYDKIQSAADATAAQNESDIESYGQTAEGLYGEGAANYDEALQNYLNGNTYTADDFSYDKTAEDFMDPYEQQKESQKTNQLNNSRASAGSYFSSDAADETADTMQQMQSDALEAAYDKLMTAKNEAREEYATNADTAYKEWQSQNDKLKSAVNIYGKDRDSLFAAGEDVLSQKINNRNANMQTTAAVTSGKASADLQDKGLMNGIIGVLSGAK